MNIFQQYIASNLNLLSSTIFQLTGSTPLVNVIPDVQQMNTVHQFSLKVPYDADAAPVDPEKRGNEETLKIDALDGVADYEEVVDLIWSTLGVLPYEVELVSDENQDILFFRRKTIIN